ncbi:hypothetical protein [Bacteroides thetaiotaomicron]|uniref:hypothetical protein n=1 Tax=Bacteroides thetaiotaomicron TaxID=818 RepID=UPI003DA6B1F1
MVIHPAARAAASLFTQSVSFSATLPFIHPSVHSSGHTFSPASIQSSGCSAV